MPISAVYGRAHPLGQPVMFSRIEASPLPVSASTFSNCVTRSGSTRSASPSAWPHVGRAGQAIASRRSALDIAGQRHAVGPQPVLDLGDSTGRDAVQQQVLAGGDPQLRDQSVGDHRAQRGAQVHPVAVGDLARRHGQADDAVACAVVLLRLPRRQFGRRVDHDPDPPANFCPHPLDAAGLDQILESGAVAVRAVAEVSVRRHDCLDDVDDVLRAHPPERLGQQRVRVLLAGVAHAESAADVHVEPGDSPVSPSESVGTMPTSLASTSTLLSPGQATVILNFRGR